MPWPDVTVPKFGNWDENGDYSIVFDKARADKERFLPTIIKENSQQQDVPIHQQHHKIGGGVLDATVATTRVRHASPYDKARPTTDRGFEMQPGGKPMKTASKATHRDHWISSDDGSTAYNGNLPISLLDEQQQLPLQMQLRTRGIQPVKSEIPSGTGRSHSSDTAPSSAKITRLQRSHEGSGRACDPAVLQPEKGAVLPKFGDWDASSAASGEGFTVIFNRACDEKKSQLTAEITSKAASPLRGQGEEDLYQQKRPSNQKKKGKGWLNTFCCIDPTQL